MVDMEDWARESLLVQQAEGRKPLEMKKLHNTHYVYRSTTV
jgi:hypothetical protein